MSSYQDTAIQGLKYLLFAFNFLIWSLGVGMVAVGIWIRGDGSIWEFVQAMHASLDTYYTATYICMSCGLLLIIFGFVGCLGASTESPCMLLGYNVITVICIALEITACCLVWGKVAGGDEMQEIYSKDIMWHIYRRNEDASSRRFLDLIQLKLECCGAETFVDYRNLGQDIPLSCNSDRTNNVHIRSCGEMLRRAMEVRGAYIGGMSIGLMIVQVMSLVFNTCLYNTLSSEYRDRLVD